MEGITQYVVDFGVRVLGVILALIIGNWVAGRVGWLVRRNMERRKVDQTLTIFAGNTTRWMIIVLVAVSCLGVFGVETTSFAAVLAAAGLAIGLAFQGTLSNVASGVMLLIMRPFKVDDVVNVAGTTAKVVEIGIFATLMDTPDNRRIIVPNSKVWGSTIENVTFHERRRVSLTVGVDYTAPLDKTREVLTQAAESVEGGSEVGIVLGNLGDSAVEWHVRVWCDTGDFWGVLEKTTDAVKRALDEAGIGIPYPQMDVHVDGALGGK